MAPFGFVAKCSSAVSTGTPQTVSTPYTCRNTYQTNHHHLFCCFFRAEGLRDYFQQFGKVYYPIFPLVPLILTQGKVDACTIMREPNGTSRGFAFLTFEDPAAVNSVVSREHFLDGKGVRRSFPESPVTPLTTVVS